MVRTIVTLALVAAALVLLIWVMQRQLIYLPAQQIPFPPVPVEEVSFSTDDGLELGAWFVSPPTTRSGTVIVFNGNAGNRSNRFSLAAALAGEGYAVLLVDYRGYGGNPGSPTEAGLASDARAALDYLRSRPDVERGRIIYFGESLGAAVATGLATEEPPSRLILRSPFPSLVDVGRVHYPFLPVSLLLRDRFPLADQIPEVSAPVMVILGTEDNIVPPELSRSVFEAASEPKSLLTIDGVGHNDPELLAGEEMIGGMTDFLRSGIP